MISLSMARFNYKYKIIELKDLTFKVKRRLYELGFLPCHIIRVLRTSLLKRSYLVEIGGYTLTIRRDIAENIYVSDKL